MAFVLKMRRNFFKINTIISNNKSTKANIDKDIKKSVFISQSKDIYDNLALEEWLYRNFNFNNHHIMMIWQNEPCITIGKHQNPWLETNVDDMNENGFKLARRYTGGSTVYHDEGNLNLTSFTNRTHYNKHYNHKVIARSLFKEYGLKTNIIPDGYLTIRNNKQIGIAASNLGWPNAFQQIVLSVNNETKKLHFGHTFEKHDVDIETKGITSNINFPNLINLCEEIPTVSINDLKKSIGWEFLRTSSLTMEEYSLEITNNKQNGFHLINPTDHWFPGISAIKNKLKSWDWLYGKTPSFNVSRIFAIPNNLKTSSPIRHLKITATVENGRFIDVALYIPPGFSSIGFSGDVSVITLLKGQKFSKEALFSLEQSFGGSINDRDKFVNDCLRKVMSSI